MIRYTRTITQSSDTREMDKNIELVLQSLYPNPLLNSPSLVKGLSFTSGTDLQVDHRLNRPVTGFIVTNSDAAAIVYQSSTANTAPGSVIILKSNATATVDIFFF